MTPLSNHGDLLRRVTKTDTDPRVRHRADALLLVAQGMPLVQVARLCKTSPSRIRAWRKRFLSEGRAGLADQPHSGRPPKLDGDANVLLVQALEGGSAASGFPVTVWSVRELRALHTLGYRYGRPRHDLRHWRDAEAVAATKRVLDWLQEGRVGTDERCGWSMSTSARFTPTHGWQWSGNGAADR